MSQPMSNAAWQPRPDRFHRIFLPTLGLWTVAGLLLCALLYLEWTATPDVIDDGGFVFYHAYQDNIEPLPLAEEDIVSLSVTRGGEEWRFERIRGAWEMTKPFRFPAQTGPINQTLHAMCQNRYAKRYLPGDATIDMNTLGLSSPRLVVAMTDKQGERYELHVGVATPEQQDNTVYAWRPDLKRVYVVGNDIAGMEQQALEQIVRKESLEANLNDARQISLYAYNKVYTFRRDPLGKRWRMEWSHGEYADDNQVQKLFKAVTPEYIDIHDPNPSNLSAYGLDDPAFRVTVVMNDDTVRELAVGTPPLTYQTMYLYARNVNYPPVFLLPPAFLEGLHVETDVIRDSLYLQRMPGRHALQSLFVTITDPNIDKYFEITRVGEGDEQHYRLTTIGDYSRMLAQQPEPLTWDTRIPDDPVMNGLRTGLFDLRGTEFIEATEANMAKYRLAARDNPLGIKAGFLNAEGQPGDTVKLFMSRIYRDTYAWLEGNAFLIRVAPGNALYDMLSNADNFRPVFLWRFPQNEQVVWLEIVGPESTRQYRKVNYVDWVMDKEIPFGNEMLGSLNDQLPTGTFADIANLKKLKDFLMAVRSFGTVRAEGRVQPGELKDFQLEPPLLKIRVGRAMPVDKENSPVFPDEAITFEELWIGAQVVNDLDFYASADKGRSVHRIDGDIVRAFFRMSAMPGSMETPARENSDGNEAKMKRLLRAVAERYQRRPGKPADLAALAAADPEFAEAWPGLQADADGVFFCSGYYLHLFLPSRHGGAPEDDETAFAWVAWPNAIGSTGKTVFVLLPGGRLMSYANNNEIKLINRRDDFGKDVTLQWLFPEGRIEPDKLNPIFKPVE